MKSVVARVTKPKEGGLRITGAAWGQAPIKAVELSIDGGPWQAVKVEQRSEPFTWRFWSYDWKNPPPGEHTLISRATDTEGRVQPAPDDPAIKLKKTYWEANQQVPRRIKI